MFRLGKSSIESHSYVEICNKRIFVIGFALPFVSLFFVRVTILCILSLQIYHDKFLYEPRIIAEAFHSINEASERNVFLWIKEIYPASIYRLLGKETIPLPLRDRVIHRITRS